MPDNRTIVNEPGALTKFTTSQTASSDSNTALRIRLTRRRITGSAASTGPLPARVVVLIGALSCRRLDLRRRHQAGRRRDDLERRQLAVLRDVDGHRVRVRVA